MGAQRQDPKSRSCTHVIRHPSIHQIPPHHFFHRRLAVCVYDKTFWNWPANPNSHLLKQFRVANDLCTRFFTWKKRYGILIHPTWTHYRVMFTLAFLENQVPQHVKLRPCAPKFLFFGYSLCGQLRVNFQKQIAYDYSMFLFFRCQKTSTFVKNCQKWVSRPKHSCQIWVT